MALVYSLMLYIWRVDKIRKRRDVKRVYYEKWGPTIVGIGLVVIVMVNFGLRMRQAGFISKVADIQMGRVPARGPSADEL